MTDQPDPAPDAATAVREPEPSPRRPRKWGRALLNLTIAGAIFVAGIGFERSGYEEYTEPDDLWLVIDAWELLYSEYVHPDRLDARAMAHGAIAGMAWAVGDSGHTGFLAPDDATVYADMLSGSAALADWMLIRDAGIGLVRLKVFSAGAGSEVAGAVEAARLAGATSLVLDLRGNPGGILDEAVAVAGVFLDPGRVVLRERDQAGEEVVHVVPPGGTPTSLPLVVLVDADTASSSEIVAAALQDAKRATIVGTTTAGTGTILEDYVYDDGGVLSIGTSRWFTPSGRSVWHVGVRPDIAVELPEGVAAMTPDRSRTTRAEESGDTQLQRAIASLTSLAGVGETSP